MVPKADATGDPAAFGAGLQAFEGRSSGPPNRAPDPVNVPMIRHFVEAVGDDNPIYLDEQAGANYGHGGLVAPPAMLQAWTMRGLRRHLAALADRAEGSAAPSASDEVTARLADAGFSSVVATDCEQEYLRELHPGDHLTGESEIESISDEKRTGLGTGHFLTSLTRYLDEIGEVVATMRFRILVYRSAARALPDEGEAPTSATPSAPGRRPRPIATRDTAFYFEGLEQGHLLIQRCSGCGVLRHPPRPVCAECGSYDWDTVVASGLGTVHSFVVAHHPRMPGFDYPHVIGLVALQEGTRLVAELRGVDAEDVRIGQEVEARITRIDDDLVLPVFHPVRPPVGKGGRSVFDVAKGEELAPLDIPITRTLIVASAIATRDYQDVHHDPELARKNGAPDVFMNILSTNGFVARFATDWAGPRAVVEAISIRLGAPNYPGDTMHMTGKVASVSESGTVEVAVVGANSLGDHVTGTVRLRLPDGGAE
jgi:uncharacterized OB-fold protein/acyl dehydratase